MPTPPDAHAALAELVEAVAASAKYHTVTRACLEGIGRQELAKRRNLREAIKAAKNKLHQVGGAYLDQAPPYAAWLTELRAAGSAAALRQTCRTAMEAHASTRERLPSLDEFYAVIFAALPPIHSVLDLACGLNPLAIPWMPLAPGATYTAYDIYEDMMGFVGGFMALPQAGVRGQAQACDVLQLGPTPRAEVALMLKAIPCLEQVDKAAGAKLLAAVQADHLVVSFPAHSLGHRDKGMVQHYEAHFRELLADRRGHIRRFQFPSELVFVVSPAQGGGS